MLLSCPPNTIQCIHKPSLNFSESWILDQDSSNAGKSLEPVSFLKPTQYLHNVISKEIYVSHDILPAIIEGEGLASWFDLCENEDAGKNEHSRWEMSSMEPNKTDGDVGKDVFDSDEELNQEQGLFFEQGNSHIHLSLPDDTSVQSHRPEMDNEESQVCFLCIVFFSRFWKLDPRVENLYGSFAELCTMFHMVK